MKNMFTDKTDAYTLEATMKAVDAFADTQVIKNTVGTKDRPMLNIDSNTEFKQLAIINDGTEKLIVNKARADKFKDILTRTFGILDSDMTSLNAKRSDLLAKDHVKHYTYKHHIWRAGWYGGDWDDIIHLTNLVLSYTRFVIDPRARKCSADYAKKLVDDEYGRVIDGYIEKYLGNWKKDAYYKILCAYMLGDGHDKIIREFNFQDDWSISDMLDREQKITKELLEHWSKMEAAGLKDIREVVKKIISDYNTVAKADKAKAKLYAGEIKRCIKYTAFFMDKLDEFLKATFECWEIQRSEIHKVLQGLLDYNGD